MPPHSATRGAGLDMGGERGGHGWLAPATVRAVRDSRRAARRRCRRKPRIGQRREKYKPRAQRRQAFEIGGVEEAEGGVAGDGDGFAGELRVKSRRWRYGEFDGGR